MAPTGPQRGSHRSAEDTLLTPKHARQPPAVLSVLPQLHPPQSSLGFSWGQTHSKVGVKGKEKPGSSTSRGVLPPAPQLPLSKMKSRGNSLLDRREGRRTTGQALPCPGGSGWDLTCSWVPVGSARLSSAGEMAAEQQKEPHPKPTSAQSQGKANKWLRRLSWPAARGKVPETTAGARGGKGPRGPAQAARASPELGTCQGPTGPAQPAAN